MEENWQRMSLYLMLKSDCHHNVIRTSWGFLNIILVRSDLIKPGITWTIDENVSRASLETKM